VRFLLLVLYVMGFSLGDEVESIMKKDVFQAFQKAQKDSRKRL
jgi:hypothetical protein